VTGFHHAAIGHEEHAMEVEPAGEMPHPLNGAPRKHDSCARLKVERDHLL
jgi:hypothetical protein